MTASKPILSICIPIYNRLQYLERMLTRFIVDKELFEKDIALYISDNCSTDDLRACCENYQREGLNLSYHRNETNIGPDRNFETCFLHATGKYVWLLGSDDIPTEGTLRVILHYLKSGDYGLVHLSMKKRTNEFTVFDSSDEMAIAVNYWFTFMSANIINKESLGLIDLSDYRKTFMLQVPAYVNACCVYKRNAILYLHDFFDVGSDAANNGGYNFFEVFVTNLYGIYMSFVQKGMLSKKTFNKMIKIEYRDFLASVIVRCAFLGQKRNYSIDGWWKRVRKYYMFKPYTYYYPILGTFNVLLRRFIPS